MALLFHNVYDRLKGFFLGVTFDRSSANAFNLYQSRILLRFYRSWIKKKKSIDQPFDIADINETSKFIDP